MRKKLLKLPIDIVTIDQATKFAKEALLDLRQFKIVTLNPEMVVNADKNPEFQEAINKSQLVIPDGTGIVWAVKLLNPAECNSLKRIPGIELAEKILEEANKLEKKVSIFGGKLKVLEQTIKILKAKYPNIKFVKSFDGYQGEEKDVRVAKEIASESPDIVLVALGTPRQEIWISRYSNIFVKSLMIGIGGSLDVWTGKKPRAPKWIRDIHLEWLFRTITDPQRIPRVLRSLPVFVWMVIQSVILSQRRRIS